MRRPVGEEDSLLDDAFTDSPVAIAVVRVDGTIERANQAFAVLYGSPLGELPGAWLETFAVPGDTILASERFGQLLAGGFSDDRCEFENRHLHTDGSERWVQASIRLRRDADGAPRRCIAHFTDLTARRQSDERLNHIVEQYELAAAALRGALYDYDIRELTISFSEGLLTNFGWDPTAFDIEARHDKIHPDDRATVRRLMREAAQNKTEFVAEYRFQRPDGSYAYVWDRSVVLRDSSGSAVRALGTLVDISERRAAEEAIREMHERFDAAAASVEGIVYDWDLSNGTSVRFGGLAGSITAPDDGGDGLSWWEPSIHPDDRVSTVRAVREALAADATEYAAEYRFQTTTGAYVVVWDRGRILRDAAGKAVRLVGGMLDATAHKEIEARSRATEARYSALVHQLPAYIASANESGGVIFLSPKTRELLRLGTDEAVSPDVWLRLLHEDDRPRMTGQLGREDRDTFDNEYRFRLGDGSVIWVADQGTIVRDEEGTPQFIQGVLFDITERKRQEQALAEANDRLSESVAELEVHNRDMKLLGELGEILQSCVSEADAYDVLAPFAQQLFPGCDGALFITRPSRDSVELVSAWGAGNITDRFSPDDCWALRRGRLHVVVSGATGLPCPHVQGTPNSGYLCLPMMAKGEALGVLHLSSEVPFVGMERLGRLAAAVGDQMGLAVANLKLRETLRLQSTRDSLTGLFNRRYMEESLTRELSRADREHAPLAVLMLDIDHFKRFNDTQGHEAGDALLRHLGAYLLKSTRAEDVVCRYGGEEIIIILPGTSLENAVYRAEQLLSGVAQLEVASHGRLLGAVTISVGIAAYPADGPTFDALLKATDDALYRAKRAGRNRVKIASARSVVTTRRRAGAS